MVSCGIISAAHRRSPSANAFIPEGLGTGTLMIPVGASGNWDDGGIREYGNFFEDQTDTGKEYKMLYTGYSGVQVGNNVFVGGAYSSDGLTWTKYSSSAALISRSSEDPYLLKHGSTYYIYAEDKQDVPFRNIRLFTTTDFATFTDQGDILDIGASGSWEDTDVSSPVVWIDSAGLWHMLYEGRASTQRGAIGHATSSDGLTWTKDAANPVFTGTNATWGYNGPSWCDAVVPDQVIFKDDGLMVLHFHGRTGDDTQFAPGVAVGRSVYTFEDAIGAHVSGIVGDGDLQPISIFNPVQFAFVVLTEGIYRAAASAAVASAPSFSVDPVISQPDGFVGVGDTLTCDGGTHDGFAPGFKWKRNGAAISGATNTSYVLVTDDLGANITCTVTVVNSAGQASATSNSLGPVVSPAFATETITLADTSDLTLADASSLTISNRTA